MHEEVLIVGAGPVGLSAAMALVKKGISVHVIEKEQELIDIPKASTIHPPTLEIFQEWGILSKVKAKSLVVNNFQYWNRQNKEKIADLDLNLLEGDTEFPYRYQCEQHELTKIFYEELKEHQLADIIFDTEIVDLKNNEEVVDVDLKTKEKITSRKYKYVIGADGASSIVRKKLNINFEGLTYPENHLLICVQNHDFTQDYTDLAPVSYFFDKEEWVALIRNKSYWKFLLPLESELKDKVDETYLQERLRNFTGKNKSYDIYHSIIYRVHQRVADSFLKGRCVLIGDAAHVNNPLGGMGMNSGIHDAFYLADYFEKIYHSGTSADILKEFEEHRQMNAKEVVQKITVRNEETARQTDTMKESIRKMQILHENKDAARDYLLESSMIKGFNYAKL